MEIVKYFSEHYEWENEYMHIKSKHAVVMLMLIILSVIGEILYSFVIQNVDMVVLISSVIAILFFIGMLYLVRNGKMLLCGNAFLIAGFAKLLQFITLSNSNAFYLQCLLGSMVGIAIYVKKYQLYAVIGMSILFTVARIPYVIYLSTTNDVINEFYMHQVLQASLGILIFMIVIAFYDYVISSEINYSTSLKKLAETDPLTNLYNRKVFDDYMNSKKLNNHCLALLDIDNFKIINDQFGHPKGDEVLREFSKCMEQELDESSTLFRWGGEEFAIISDSPNSEFNVLLESFRSNLALKDFELGRPVTVSIGYVCLSDFENPMKAMIEADDALYQAKSNGKNQVVRAKS